MHAFLKWAVENYEFMFLMKVDDDTWVRLDVMYDEMMGMRPRERLYWGWFWSWRQPKPRDPDYKWYDPIYPYETYPKFASGALFVLSRDMVKHIAEKDSTCVLVMEG